MQTAAYWTPRSSHRLRFTERKQRRYHGTRMGKSADYWSVLYDINEIVYQTFNEEGIGFPFRNSPYTSRKSKNRGCSPNTAFCRNRETSSLNILFKYHRPGSGQAPAHSFPPANIFHAPALSTAPINGPTMKIHNWLKASPP